MNNNSYFCSVCGAPIKRQQKQTAVGQRTNIIPKTVCEIDHICQSCCKLAVQSYEQSKASVTLEMKVFEDTKQSFNGKCTKNGDNNVCLICGTSLSSRQSLLIIKPDPTELDHLMLNLIRDALPPQTKIGSKDKVCSKCWFKIRRSAIHLQQINKLEPNGIRDENWSMEIKSDPESDQEHSDLMVEVEEHHSEEIEDQKETIESEQDADDLSIDDIKDDPDDPDFTVKYPTNKIQEKDQNEPEVSAEIMLPNYKRCSTSSSSCVFQGCKNPERRRIPNEIRERMLRDYKFYISKDKRVCQQHFQSNKWHDLCTSSTTNKQYKFNTKQIEDMFSMVQIKKSTDLDFNNILNFDECFIEHLLGIKREILTSILTREPKIKKTCNGLNGLLGLLLKHENGGPDIRIKSLLNISRTTLKRAMEDVKKILLKSLVTKELGIEYLLKVK